MKRIEMKVTVCRMRENFGVFRNICDVKMETYPSFVQKDTVTLPTIDVIYRVNACLSV